LKEVIEPALRQGLVVLSDRYQDATRAYQGAARGIPAAEIEKLTQALGIIEPDKTILLDLDPEEGLLRARLRNKTIPSAGAEGRFEAEDLSFHRRVRAAYLDLAAQYPERIRVVQASGASDEVFSRLVPLLDMWIPKGLCGNEIDVNPEHFSWQRTSGRDTSTSDRTGPFAACHDFWGAGGCRQVHTRAPRCPAIELPRPYE
jgi:hypothetical protein